MRRTASTILQGAPFPDGDYNEYVIQNVHVFTWFEMQYYSIHCQKAFLKSWTENWICELKIKANASLLSAMFNFLKLQTLIYNTNQMCSRCFMHSTEQFGERSKTASPLLLLLNLFHQDIRGAACWSLFSKSKWWST